METYSLLRQFADSWVLLALFVFFIGVVIFAFRPGSTKAYSDVANIPFRHEDAPEPPRGDDNTADNARDARPEEA